MTATYIGNIMMTGFGFAQKNFAQCNGQTMAIGQNQALFALIGTTYGGNGINTFALPDLRSRVPAGGGFGQGAHYALGEVGGVENVALTGNQMPIHTHQAMAVNIPGTDYAQAGGELFGSSATNFYGSPNTPIPMSSAPSSKVGQGNPHSNIQPYVAINFNICLSGIFPSRN